MCCGSGPSRGTRRACGRPRRTRTRWWIAASEPQGAIATLVIVAVALGDADPGDERGPGRLHHRREVEDHRGAAWQGAGLDLGQVAPTGKVVILDKGRMIARAELSEAQRGKLLASLPKLRRARTSCSHAISAPLTSQRPHHLSAPFACAEPSAPGPIPARQQAAPSGPPARAAPPSPPCTFRSARGRGRDDHHRRALITSTAAPPVSSLRMSYTMTGPWVAGMLGLSPPALQAAECAC